MVRIKANGRTKQVTLAARSQDEALPGSVLNFFTQAAQGYFQVPKIQWCQYRIA